MNATNANQDIPVVAPRPNVPRRRRIAKWLSLAIALVVVGAVGAALMLNPDKSSQLEASPGATVKIAKEGFEPNVIKIKKGETVTWTNTDQQPHELKSDPYGAEVIGSDEPLAEGESYTATFEESGIYPYHDSLDPTGFKATVIVE